MIIVAHRREIENQRWPATDAQCGGGKQSAFETVRGVVTDDQARRVARVAALLLVVRQVIQIFLNFFGSRQGAQQLEFAFGQFIHPGYWASSMTFRIGAGIGVDLKFAASTQTTVT